MLACPGTHWKARRALHQTTYGRRKLLGSVWLALALLVAPAGAFAQVAPLPPVSNATGKLGLCDVLPGSPASGPDSWAQLAYNAGARTDRWEFRWDKLEPQPGQWDFSSTDAAVSSARTTGLDVEGILIGTPGWGAAPGQAAGNGLPSGLYRPARDPRNLWADFVRGTVSRYSDQVHTWEIWNEPDTSFFWTSGPDAYFRLLKVAYATIKAVDPGARVLLGGMLLPDLAFAKRVLADAAADPAASAHRGYFDIAAWHAYGSALSVYQNVRRLKDALSGYGFTDKPIWLTEAGFPAASTSGTERQAAFVLQSIAYGLAAGAKKILVYRASDDTDPKTWGLVGADGQPRMSYVAFQVAASYLDQAGMVVYDPLPRVERFQFFESSLLVTLLWNRDTTDRTISTPLLGTAAETVSWMGKAQQLDVAAGSTSIVLPGASYNSAVDPQGSLVGGPPVLLVESNPLPPSGPGSLFAAPMTAGSRKLVLYGPTTWSAAVAVPGDRVRHETLAFSGGTPRMVDLTALAGGGEGGPLPIWTHDSLSGLEVGDSATEPIVPPSRTAYFPTSPTAVEVRSAATVSAQVRLETYGSAGGSRAQQVFHVRPGSTQIWNVPGAGASASLVAVSTQPIALFGVDGQLPVQVAAASWYLARSPGGVVFNPDSRNTVSATVHVVSATGSTSSEIKLAPHARVAVSTPGAQMVSINSAAPLAVQSESRVGAQATPGSPARQSTVLTAAVFTHAEVYNPGSTSAHVMATIVGARAPAGQAVNIPADGVTWIKLRSASAAPRAAILQSDQPVLAVPTS